MYAFAFRTIAQEGEAGGFLDVKNETASNVIEVYLRKSDTALVACQTRAS